MYLKMSHVPSMYPPVHNAGTLKEHLSTTIQLLLAITLQAHVEVTFQMWRKCYWQSHWMQMLRLHLKCEWNVSGWNIGRTFCQSLQCSQHVNTCFHRPSPPVWSEMPGEWLFSPTCPAHLIRDVKQMAAFANSPNSLIGDVRCQSVFFWSPFSTLFSPTPHLFYLYFPLSRFTPTSRSRKDNVFHC